jgi:hypothetical protein
MVCMIVSYCPIPLLPIPLISQTKYVDNQQYFHYMTEGCPRK